MGSGLSDLYARFFHFPVFEYHLRPAIVLAALGLSTAAGIAGTSSALAHAMRLPPAEAMRPLPPARFRPTFIERLGFEHLLSPAARMVLREIGRRPFKAAVSCFGISLAAAVLVVGNYLEDAIQYAVRHQFGGVMRYDASVALFDPREESAIAEIRHMPGVERCEPYRSLAVRLVSGHRSRRIGVMGLDRADGLFRLADVDGRQAQLPPGGLVMSRKLAEILDLSIGDDVTMEVLEEERPTLRVPVTGLLDDFAGLAAYMRLDALQRIMRQGDRVSGAFILVDPAEAEGFYERLREAPRVTGVSVKSAALESFRRTIAESLLLMKTFFSAFAMIIAFGVVYNGARISLAERSRELATLRVVGFTRAEVSMTQLWLGRQFVTFVSAMFESELFRIPPIVAPATYGSAAVVVLVATLVSGLVVRRMLDALDLVAVLKARE
jgi:putative ABC transport system permease protein